MTEPIRVVHVITDLDTGGAEMMLYRLLTGLDRNIIESRVVSLTDQGPISKKIRYIGIDVTSLGMKPGSLNPTGIFRLASSLRESKTDLVQTWMYHSDLIGGLAAWAAGRRKVIWGIHNSTLDPKKSKARTRMIVRINSFLSGFVPKKIIVCSQAALNVHLNAGYRKDRMQFIPNGFDLSEFQLNLQAKINIRQELGIPQDSFVAGTAARFDPQQDHPNLLAAASLLLANYPQLHFVLCGDGMVRENLDLMKLVSPIMGEERIHLIGRRTDMAAVTASWNLAVLPSSYGEAFPLVIGEAMACGVPCVVTDVGDSGTIVGETGRVVPPHNPERLAQGIEEIINLSPSDKAALGIQARERILNNYDLSKAVKKYTDVYLDSIKPRYQAPAHRPIRVTHVITDLDTGGAEIMLYKLLDGLDRSLISSRVVSLTDEGPIGRRIKDIGIDVTSLGMKPGSLNPAGIFKLASNLQDANTELVQTWMYHADLIGGAAALVAGRMPTIWNIRNSTLDKATSKMRTRLIVRLNAWLSHFLPRSVLVCSMRAQTIHETLGYDRQKMWMIPNGFNLKEFKPDPQAKRWLRRHLNLDIKTPVIGLVARFDPQKDLQTFIEACKIVSQNLPDVHFVLCGDRLDGENEILMDWITNANLTDKFHLLGRRSDIPQITAGFDLAISSSAYGEAFSNVVGEAMACAVPCVVTDVGDAAVIVADTGRIVPPRNPASLASGIIDMMKLPQSVRSRMGEEARKRITMNYDLVKIIEAYTKVYLEVIS